MKKHPNPRGRLERNWQRLVNGFEDVRTRMAIWTGAPTVSTYWWRARSNFGDCLGPLLFRRRGVIPVYQDIHVADVITVGSLLQELSSDFAGAVVGSGFVSDGPSVDFPNARFYSVRGKLTRQRLAMEELPLGDPGILASELVPAVRQKKYGLGIIPHYSDLRNELFSSLISKNRNDLLFIDVRQSAQKVLQQISSCEYIVSSSLHGLIVADSYNVPNRWIRFQTGDDYIGKYKFRDYFSSIDTEQEPLQINGGETVNELVDSCLPVSNAVDQLKVSCNQAMQAFLDNAT